MGEPTDIVPSRAATLSQALRRLRRLRGLRPGAVADAMGLERRTYEYFEAGRGKLNVDRVHSFAQILDVDPYAILAAVEIRSPEFAVECAEHKLMTVFMITLQEFDAIARGRIARLNPATIVSGFTRVLDAFAREARDGDDFVETWMGDDDPPDDAGVPGPVDDAEDDLDKPPD
jgi:transcriptional regulator with XRE-family HTH domain